MNILFYGNCQMEALRDVMNVNSIHDWNVTTIKCWETNISKEDFRNLLLLQHIVIVTCIGPGYRGTDYLDTLSILQTCLKTTHVFIVPTLFFRFYHPDLIYLRNKNNKDDHCRTPIDYHYRGMVDCYKSHKPLKVFFDDYVNNPELYSQYELNKMVEYDIQRMKKSENTLAQHEQDFDNCKIVYTSDWIYENYKKQYLFYSMNHPTKFLFQFIANNIWKGVNVHGPDWINYDVCPLEHTRPYLYKCIQNNVNFDTTQYDRCLMGVETDKTNIAKTYVNEYVKVDIFAFDYI